jgi:hypothetical protein
MLTALSGLSPSSALLCHYLAQFYVMLFSDWLPQLELPLGSGAKHAIPSRCFFGLVLLGQPPECHWKALSLYAKGGGDLSNGEYFALVGQKYRFDLLFKSWFDGSALAGVEESSAIEDDSPTMRRAREARSPETIGSGSRMPVPNLSKRALDCVSGEYERD